MALGTREARGARASWQALGTSAVVQVADRSRLAAAHEAARAELMQIDIACSRFRADSELCAVNASAGRAIRIGPLLAEAIELSLRAAALTDGAVDPTIGRSLAIAGYDRDWSLIELESPRPCGASSGRGRSSMTREVTVRRLSSWQRVQLDVEGLTVRIPRGASLDLGAVAKALAADRAAAAAAHAAGCGVLVAVGGDIAVSGAAPPERWHVRVTDDHRSSAGACGQTVTVRGGGLATSGSTVRRWWRDGREMHHIIDPSTGSPARSPWRTASVAAASCVDANIAATAALVKGKHGAAWLRERLLPARLVDHAGAVTCIGGWPHAGGAHA
jgi:thiamine biosynthesis lipoprotein